MKSLGKRASKYAIVPCSGEEDKEESRVGGDKASTHCDGEATHGNLEGFPDVGGNPRTGTVAVDRKAKYTNSKDETMVMTSAFRSSLGDQGNAEEDSTGWTDAMRLQEGGSSTRRKKKSAYALFQHLDVDSDDKISAWELARFLPSVICCTAEKTMELTLYCQSLGLAIEEDEEGMVVVAGWDEGSAAAEHPSLMVGMRILSIDGWDLPCALGAASNTQSITRAQSCLGRCQRVIEALRSEENVEHFLEFVAPAVIVTEKNRWLDMDVDGHVIAVSAPLGLYVTEQAYLSALQEAGRHQHPKKLRSFGIKYDLSQPFAVLSTGGVPFRLLWGSGANRSMCCRNLLHCDEETDTEAHMSHTTGHRDALLIEGTQQRLNLTPGALTAFAEHLILEARGGTGTGGSASSLGVDTITLGFEDFFSLYETYLSSQEGYWKARNLVMMAFMGKEESAEVAERQAVDEARRKRLRRMIRHRQANKERKRQQLTRMLETGAHVRVGGLIQVQNRGWAEHVPGRAAPSPRAMTDRDPATAPDSDDKPPNTLPEEEVGTESDGGKACEERGEHAMKEEGGSASGGGKGLKAASHQVEGVYSEEALAKRRAHILQKRDRMKAIKRAQEKAIKAKLLESMKKTQTFEAGLNESELWGATRRALELAKLGLEDCRTGQTGKRPQPEDIHPAFLGYFHSRRSNRGSRDPMVRSPVFFGKLSGPLTRLEASRGGGNLEALRTLVSGAALAGRGDERQERQGNQRACMAFPLAPTSRGKVRQRLREVGENYDRAGVVHPSCFGLITIPDTQDCRYQTPVFFGYDLTRKPTGRAGGLAEDEQPQREDYVAHREGKTCAVCLVGKPGCPCCWNFPEGWVPHDFAYLGPFQDSAQLTSSRPNSVRRSSGASVSSVPALSGRSSRAAAEDGGASVSSWPGGVGRGVSKTGGAAAVTRDARVQEEGREEEQRDKPDFHTDLTTTAAIELYRSVVARIIRIFVKVIPCGTATCLWMDSSWPVSYLYDLWRANATEGNTEDAFMFLPTTAGQWNLDNRNLPETDTTLGVHTGDLPLSTYNLTTPKSTVTVLCTTFFSAMKTKESIKRYLVYEVGVGREVVTEVLNHLVGCPKHPENDPIQKALCGLMEHRVEQQQKVDDDDGRAELAVRNALLLDAEKTRKTAALAVKRQQVAQGSKEWRAEQKKLRDEAAAAATGAPLGEDMTTDAPATTTSVVVMDDSTGEDWRRGGGLNGDAALRVRGGNSGGDFGHSEEQAGAHVSGGGATGVKLSKLNMSFVKKLSRRERVGTIS